MIIIYSFTNDQGIGDNYRGLVSLLQIKEKIKSQKDITIYVDFTKSRINKYLLKTMPENLIEQVEKMEIAFFFVKDSPEKIPVDDEIISYILNTESNIIRMNSNNYPDVNIMPINIKTFLKGIFNFTPEFEAILNTYYDKMPFDFDLYHYRLGDRRLIYHDNDDDEINRFFEWFKEMENTNNNNCIVISDSLCFKKKLYDNYNNNKVHVFLNKPTHIAYSTDQDDIHILIDFVLVSKAKNIYCYSNYGWISNFILWTSYVYDIPLFNMKN